MALPFLRQLSDFVKKFSQRRLFSRAKAMPIEARTITLSQTLNWRLWRVAWRSRPSSANLVRRIGLMTFIARVLKGLCFYFQESQNCVKLPAFLITVHRSAKIENLEQHCDQCAKPLRIMNAPNFFSTAFGLFLFISKWSSSGLSTQITSANYLGLCACEYIRWGHKSLIVLRDNLMSSFG